RLGTIGQQRVTQVVARHGNGRYRVVRIGFEIVHRSFEVGDRVVHVYAVRRREEHVVGLIKFVSQTECQRMVTGEIVQVVGDVQRRVVQLVAGREGVETYRGVSASAVQDIDRGEETGFVATVFDLLVERCNEVVGKFAGERCVPFSRYRARVVF